MCRCAEPLGRACRQNQPVFVCYGRISIMLSYEEMLLMDISDGKWLYERVDFCSALPTNLQDQYKNSTLVNWKCELSAQWIRSFSGKVLPRNTKMIKGKCWHVGSKLLALDPRLGFFHLDLLNSSLQWQPVARPHGYPAAFNRLAKRTLRLGDRVEAFIPAGDSYAVLRFWTPHF